MALPGLAWVKDKAKRETDGTLSAFKGNARRVSLFFDVGANKPSRHPQCVSLKHTRPKSGRQLVAVDRDGRH
jgi:hypothetical protein